MSIAFGATSTLTFRLSNTDQTLAVSGLAFTDTFPSGMVVATPNGLSGSCGGGTITATANSAVVSLSGATLAARAECTFSVKVTTVITGVFQNVTSALTSDNAGPGATASATLTVTPGKTKTTVTASPAASALGASVTITAVVTPTKPVATQIIPTGTVAFYVNGATKPAAVVTLVGRVATFSTTGLTKGSNTVTADYLGDIRFSASSGKVTVKVK